MKRIFVFLLGTVWTVAAHAQPVALPPYKNPDLPVPVRVEDLLKRMTLEQKAEQLCMKGLSALKFGENGEVTEESLEALFKGKSIGVLESPFWTHEDIAKVSAAADRYLRERTPLGIPAIQIAECLHGQMALGATIFPQAVAQGSTWNPDLIREMSAAVAREATAAGVDQALSPLFDLAKDPRYGRVEECFGENPYHVARMGVAFVEGMQGSAAETKERIKEDGLMCTAKHFAAYSFPQAGINIAPVLLGERSLREEHFYPFEKAVEEANIYAVMPGYHEVDGIPVHANSWLNNEVLREEWGFDGYVFSDYGAIGMLHGFHRTASDAPSAALSALNAGVDLEAPSAWAYSHIPELVRSGQLDMAVVDRAVRRVLTAKFRAGLFDKPYTVPADREQRIHTPEHVALARRIAEEAIILLKNEGDVLPLDRSRLKSIAVIGPNADQVQFGDYSITKDNRFGVTPLQAIREAAGDGVKIRYARGCGITDLSRDGIREAVQAARASDVTVLVTGGTSSTYSGIGWGRDIPGERNTCGEGYDRHELDHPGVQPELIRAVVETGKPVVLVMVHGRAYTIGWEKEHIPAIVETWYNGEQAGTALAGVLFGDVNPSGKLPVSVPASTGHIPVTGNYKPSARGYYRSPGTPEKPGRDYVCAAPAPLFCFGHGLSYTEFTYADLKISTERLHTDGVAEVSFTLTNSGDRDGAEVAQLYVNDVYSSVTTPVRDLKGFRKVFLKKGESKRVVIELKKSDLYLWNPEMKRVLEPGDFEIYVGGSSENLPLKGVLTI